MINIFTWISRRRRERRIARLRAELIAGWPIIEDCDFGQIVVNTITTDRIIAHTIQPGEIKADYWGQGKIGDDVGD